MENPLQRWRYFSLMIVEATKIIQTKECRCHHGCRIECAEAIDFKDKFAQNAGLE